MTAAEKEAIRKAQKLAEEERQRQMEAMAKQQEEARKKAEELAEIERNKPPPPPPPPPKPQPPPVNYKFIGYIGPASSKIAVLHDGTDMVFVKQGDVLPKGIRVLEIGYESIKFGFSDPQFKDESRTLPMSSSY
jgi:sRNA-binding protein